MNIYEVASQYSILLDKIAEGHLELEDMKDTLDSMKDHALDVLESMASKHKNTLIVAEALKEEQKKLKEREQNELLKAERLKESMKNLMLMIGVKKIEGVHELSFRKGSEVVEIDEDKLPKFEDYPSIYDVVPESHKLIGKAELKKMVKNGEVIEGVSVVRKEDTLQIK